MTLFENIALNDDTEVINHRKASAVAHKRVQDRFGAFLANAKGDLPARLALVEDDIQRIVEDVVAEHGGNASHIEAAIKQSLGPMGPGMGPAMGPGGMAASPVGVPPMGAPGAAPGASTCPQCGGQMVGGQCPTCASASGDTGAYALNHTMPQVPGTGPMSSVQAAGGFCDDCHKWKSGPKAGCTCGDSGESGKEGVTDIDGELEKAPSAVGAGKESNIHEAEALETVKLPKGDESGLGGPSPKIDKGNSGDNWGWNLDPVDTQMDGSPNPTIEQDPTDKADYAKKDFLDQTNAVVETETLPTSTNFDDAGFNTERNIEQPHTDTWSGKGDQTNPVTRESLSNTAALGDVFPDPHDSLMCSTPGCGKVLDPREKMLGQGQCQNCLQASPDPMSTPSSAVGDRLNPAVAATDPDKNPIRTILEEYEGFLMPNQVESAVQDWDGRAT